MLPSTRFLAAVIFVLDHETVFAPGHAGDYAHAVWERVKGDNGGLTKFGIDERSHPGVDIANLNVTQARDIYLREYWEPCRADEMPLGWGEVLFDIRVNGGDGPRLCQRAVNTWRGKNAKPIIKEDGQLGPISLAAMIESGREGLELFLNERQARYNRLALKPGQSRFLAGWTARNADLRRFVFALPLPA